MNLEKFPQNKKKEEKRKMGKEETRSAVMERGATALTIRGCAWPFLGWSGFGRQGGGGTGRTRESNLQLDLSGREKCAAG